MKRYKSSFERFLEASERTADIMLRYAYQKKMIMDDLLSKEQIDRIVDQVIQRMHITVDASKVIDAIQEIKAKLNELGDK